MDNTSPSENIDRSHVGVSQAELADHCFIQRYGQAYANVIFEKAARSPAVDKAAMLKRYAAVFERAAEIVLAESQKGSA